MEVTIFTAVRYVHTWLYKEAILHSLELVGKVPEDFITQKNHVWHLKKKLHLTYVDTRIT